MSKVVRIGLLAVIAIGVALLFLPRSRTAVSLPQDEASSSLTGAATDAERTEGGSQGLRFAKRDRGARGSLSGTEVAGALLVDDDGNFYPSTDAIALFDYFLSAAGEKPDEDIVARIREEIRRRLSPPADAQALAFLDRYLSYRERGIALAATDAGDDDLRARFDRLRALRRDVFGEELAARLFGDEEAGTEVTLRQREIAIDPNLDEAEKADRIEKLYDELPEPMREARKQMLAATTLRADEARIRAEGGSEEDVRAMRVERFGEEAADRLEELDERRAEWDSRLDAFRSERARILADASLTAQQQRSAIARLLEDSFDEAERVRVEALDRLAAESNGDE
jgi:lipase chaperone LimK